MDPSGALRHRGATRRPHVTAVLALAVGLLAAGCGPTGASTDPDATAATTTSESARPGLFDDEGVVGETGGADEAPTPPPLHPSVDDYPAGRVVVDPGDGAELLEVLVRVADTGERRQHGLMEVPEVPDGVGMWFTYHTDHTGAFWMKGTLTDLDIAWVDDSGEIVAIETMTPCAEEPCPRYDPGATYRRALEVRAGWYGEHEVEVGDRILADGADPA